MRSRHIPGCLAGTIVLPLRRAGFTCCYFGAFSRAQQYFLGRHSKFCPPKVAYRSHPFATTASAHSRADRSNGSPVGSATKDGSASLSLPEHAREILRHMADSVVVCTAHSQNVTLATGEATDVPVGLTMSSFTPLSLFPSPVITFNIAVPSRTEAAIAKARHFMIHILSGDVKGARLADVFRTGNAHPANTLRELRRSGCEVVWPPGAPVPHQDERQPFLQGVGVLYVLRCRLLDEPLGGLVPVRDHVVVVGEILEIIAGEAEVTDSTGAPCFGLLYGNRRYRQLNGAIMPTGSGQ